LSVLGGGNVVTWSTNGRLKAKLGGSRLNKLNRYGRGNTDLILVSLGNIVKVEVELPEPSLVMTFAPPSNLAFKVPFPL
jgi:hypothetical protein